MLRNYNSTFGFCVLVTYKSLQSNLLLEQRIKQAVVKIKLHVDELGSHQLLNCLKLDDFGNLRLNNGNDGKLCA